MNMEKGYREEYIFSDGSVPSEPPDAVVGENKGTISDVEDMKRMGKKQLFRRNFNFLTIFGFAMILINTWQAFRVRDVLLISASYADFCFRTLIFGLPNGGSAGLIYMYIVVAVFFSLVNISMAEMASMAPTAGGQYHWISEFAPRSLQKQLSYLIGWLCVLGWQTGSCIGCFLAGTQIEGLIVLNHPGYIYERWHGTLLTIAVVFFVAFFNTVFAKHLPLVEGLVLCLHVGGFVAILVSLWVLGPRTPSEQVWTRFADEGQWGSVGLACLVGMLTPTTAFLGADAAVHMSEELKNASKTLPRAMIWTSVVNGAMGFVMLITILYTMGDFESVISTPTGYPYQQIFYNATGSRGGATAMSCIIVLAAVANGMTNMATASRQLFAFARDEGVPFHEWFAAVSVRWKIPLNAVLFTILFSCILSLVNIGSTYAFNQINSLGVCALLSSYIISIGCVLMKRLRGERLLERRFSLGKFGTPINVAGLCFLAVAFVFSFFPPVNHPAANSMNWSSAVYAFVIAFAAFYYFVQARHQYVGPVEYLRKGE